MSRNCEREDRGLDKNAPDRVDSKAFVGSTLEHERGLSRADGRLVGDVELGPGPVGVEEAGAEDVEALEVWAAGSQRGAQSWLVGQRCRDRRTRGQKLHRAPGGLRIAALDREQVLVQG